VERAKRRGAHRRKRERKPWEGMMLHQAVSAGATDFGAQISGGEQDVYGSAIAPLWRQISS
jgi:hypothetical protein